MTIKQDYEARNQCHNKNFLKRVADNVLRIYEL